MTEQSSSEIRSQVLFILISAGLFAWFGFRTSWAHQYTNTQPPELVTMVVVLKWTLRVGAIAFGLSAILSMAGLRAGPAIYALAGVVTAALFLIVAIWDWSSPYYCGIPVVLLVIFAVWNGFSSWTGLRAALGERSAAPAE